MKLQGMASRGNFCSAAQMEAVDCRAHAGRPQREAKGQGAAEMPPRQVH